jgi:predicted RNase H-like HicB family nuclease
MQITFELTPCEESGGYVARWDDPAGGGISTQGDSFAELDDMVRDAVAGYFVEREKPASIRLHFVRDPELVPA